MEAWGQSPAVIWRHVQPVFNKVSLVMIGGGLGALSRYGIGLLEARFRGTAHPWSTSIVNLSGCFLIGLLYALFERTRLAGPDLRLLLITGYLGALTTFSTFALETSNTWRCGATSHSLTNILVNNIGGLILVVLGMRLGGVR